MAVTVGLISDTHGLLRPEAVRALAAVRCIVHAGDIGGPEILEQLGALAPVHAVRGNNDRDDWATELPLELSLRMEGVEIRVLHDVKELDVTVRESGARQATGGYQVVVAGHSHKPAVIERGGVLFVNPGSAGPRRFRLPVAVGYLDLENGTARARILEIV